MAKRARSEQSDGFHEKKGRYVAISPDHLTATRAGDTYDHGVCFSQKPLKLGDVFQLRINEMDTKWAGSLRLGVTTCSPDQSPVNIVRAATDLFSDDFQDFWILSGSRLHHGLSETDYSLNLHSLKVDSRVGVQVTQNGDLVFYADGASMGAATCGLPTKKPIYCIFDIYGRTKVISKELFQAERLEDVCKKKIKKLVKDENLDKLFLPKCMVEDIKRMNTLDLSRNVKFEEV